MRDPAWGFKHTFWKSFYVFRGILHKTNEFLNPVLKLDKNGTFVRNFLVSCPDFFWPNRGPNLKMNVTSSSPFWMTRETCTTRQSWYISIRRSYVPNLNCTWHEPLMSHTYYVCTHEPSLHYHIRSTFTGFLFAAASSLLPTTNKEIRVRFYCWPDPDPIFELQK